MRQNFRYVKRGQKFEAEAKAKGQTLKANAEIKAKLKAK